MLEFLESPISAVIAAAVLGLIGWAIRLQMTVKANEARSEANKEAHEKEVSTLREELHSTQRELHSRDNNLESEISEMKKLLYRIAGKLGVNGVD